MADEAFLLICHIPGGTPTIKKKKKRQTQIKQCIIYLSTPGLPAILEKHKYRGGQVLNYPKAKPHDFAILNSIF